MDVDGCTKIAEIKPSYINLGSGLELTNTCRYDSTDLEHNVRDSIGGAAVAAQARYTFYEQRWTETQRAETYRVVRSEAGCK